MCDAFESEMHLPLLAVLSNPCERLDLANEIYAELTGVVECLCAAGESGAIPAREVLKHNDRINTSRHIAQRKLREAIAQGNEKAADASLTELFGYIAGKNPRFPSRSRGFCISISCGSWARDTTTRCPTARKAASACKFAWAS